MASFRDQRNSDVERTVDFRLSFVLQRKLMRYSKLFFSHRNWKQAEEGNHCRERVRWRQKVMYIEPGKWMLNKLPQISEVIMNRRTAFFPKWASQQGTFDFYYVCHIYLYIFIQSYWLMITLCSAVFAGPFHVESPSCWS